MWHLEQMSTFKGCLVALTWTTVNFWTKVSSSSFAETKVPFAIRNESKGAKNNRVKPRT